MTPYHNTLCLQCNTVCHEQCSLNETTQIGEYVFRHCTIMNNGQCTICPGKCSYDLHYHDRRLIKCIPRTLKFAISSLSNKYTEEEQDKAKCEIKCKTVQETKRLVEQLLQEQFNKVQDACMRVLNKCQGFNIAEELCTFITLLKNDMNSLRSPSVIRNATKLMENLEILANDSSITLSKPLRSPVTRQRTRTSKKRNQLQVTESIIINQSSIPTSLVQVDHDPFTRIQASQQRTAHFSNSQKYAEYSTEQLIDLTRQSIEKHVLIAKELNRRCEGSSIGYLSSAQLLTLCEYYASSRLLEFDELICLHSQLQLEIQQSTDSNPFKILSVPIDKLLHLTAIKLCLKNADKYQ